MSQKIERNLGEQLRVSRLFLPILKMYGDPDRVGACMRHPMLQACRNQQVVACGKLKPTVLKLKNGAATNQDHPLGPLLIVPEARITRGSEGDDMLQSKLTARKERGNDLSALSVRNSE